MSDHTAAINGMVFTQVIQVTLLILLVALITRVFCRHRPFLAMALWCVVLIKCVVPPLVHSPLGVFCQWQPAASIFEDIEAAGRTVQSVTFNAGSPAAAGATAGTGVDTTAGSETPAPDAHAVTSSTPTTSTLLSNWWTMTICVWVLGAWGLLLVYGVRYFTFWRAIRRECRAAGSSQKHTSLQRHLRRLSRYVGLRRVPRLIISSRNLGPAVFGVLRPTVVLPAALVRQCDGRQLTPILLHELLHIRRRDLWLALHCAIVRAVWWFYPPVWWAVRQAERESERCCDESVVACMPRNPARYAYSLITALEQAYQFKSNTLVPGVRPVDITAKRLERIMKQRHGSRRAPATVLILAVLTAALVVPGAAGGRAQSPEPGSKTEFNPLSLPALPPQRRFFYQETPRLKSDQGHWMEVPAATQYQSAENSVDSENKVQPAGYATTVVDQQAGQEATRKQGTEPKYVVVYEVSDLLKKLRQDLHWPANSTNEQLQRALVSLLQEGPLASDDFTSVTYQLPESRLHDTASSSSHLECNWHGNQLVVSATRPLHDWLNSELALRRQQGFQQVAVEVRIMQAGPELCMPPQAEPPIAEGEQRDHWVYRWMLFPHSFASAGTEGHSQHLDTRGAEGVKQVPHAASPAASLSTAKSDPIVYQFMHDDDFASFIVSLQSLGRNQIVFAPKVTLFVGQTAEIADTSQRPFVTDVIEQAGDKGVAYQPVIQVFWEGTRIQLNPTKTPDGHHMKCRFMFASIDDCKTFRSPSYPDADVRIQHPVISTANFECSVDIPQGQTLLIGGLFPRQVEQEGESSVLGRLLRLSPPKTAHEQVTYIAITPRAVWPSSEASEAVQRENSK